MSKLYLITGGTGHLGTNLLSLLRERGEHIRLLVLPGEEQYAPDGTEVCVGEVTRPETLPPFFDRDGYDQVTLIHCAALITIASRPHPRLWEVNVGGTDTVMRMATEAGIDRVVYVSSVHAIPAAPEGQVISEVDHFSADLVDGQYARSKAAAAQKVLEYARRGLNVSIVHPSGIIGPGDLKKQNHMIRTIQAMASGKIPVSMAGGYDFVDARDVADGILSCEEKGEAGECYILSGHYVTMKELLNTIRRMQGEKENRIEIPYGIVHLAAPIAERVSLLMRSKTPLLTPYSVSTLHTNGKFSHEKATRQFGYAPRDIAETIRDSL